jgi:uncharacterized protein YhfF
MTPEAEMYWAHFKATNPSIDDSRLYEAFCFGDSEALAEELGALVVAGSKRATAGSAWSLEAEGKSPPKPGDYSIVTTWAGQPLCIVQTISIEIIPFISVSADFAATEGEGDGSLEFWRSAHTAYFERECIRLGRTFTDDMPVVCERFQIAFPLHATSAA